MLVFEGVLILVTLCITAVDIARVWAWLSVGAQDTTTGHLMCECPMASHNHSEPESEAFPALRDGAEKRREWSQNNNWQGLSSVWL